MVIGWLMRLLAPAWAVLIHSSSRLYADRFAGSLQMPAKLAMVEQSLHGKVVSRGFVLLVGAVLILSIGGLTMRTWSVRGVTTVLVVVALAKTVGAAELGFPNSCIELTGMLPMGLQSHTFSMRDSVLFSFDWPNRRTLPGEASHFIAWDTKTGNWLARMPVPELHSMCWEFSPDGTLLAVPIATNTRVVQLWEVGSKDRQGVPSLHLIAKLPQRHHRPILSDLRREGHAGFADVVRLAWTPDGKTLLAQHQYPKSQIQFWSRTDKPSVWDESDRETKWKPWAILEFDSQIAFGFTVSPDNRSLAVLGSGGRREGTGQIFDLATAELREEFHVKRPPRKPYEAGNNYHLKYSADSKTLAISDNRYLALWDTTTLKPRVEMEKPDFLDESDHPHHRMAFLQDERWLLTVKSATQEDCRRFTGGLIQLQFRNVQTGELRKEVAFPKELGLLDVLETLPDGRVMTRFAFRKKNQDFGVRYFLWPVDDLLRYAAEHGSTQTPR